MTARHCKFLAGISLLLAAGPVAAAKVDWNKDPAKGFEAGLAEEKPAAPSAAPAPVQSTEEEIATPATAMVGQFVESAEPPYQDSFLKPVTGLVVREGAVFVEDTRCRTQADGAAPACKMTRLSFPRLRYDAARKAILWDDEVAAVQGQDSSQKFTVCEGFALKTHPVPVFIEDRPVGDMVLVTLAKTASRKPLQPSPR